MTQEEKDLLLKDLCGRLPYGVKAQVYNHWRDDFQDETITIENLYQLIETFSIGDIKPYLFPMSSMTEEQCYKLASIRSGFQDCWKYIKTPIPLSICNFEQIDWLNKNHLDYRGLIEKSLALDATGLNIY